jgi:hypothetical protein
MPNNICYDNNQILIKGKRASWGIITILFFLMIISGLIPIAATILVLIYGDGLHFGLVISYLLFWGGGYYLLRLVLWNTYGQEIFTLENDKIRYIADYKLFKDGRQEIDTQNLKIEIITHEETNKPVGRLKLTNGNTSIVSVLSAGLNDLKEIAEKLKNNIRP